MLNQVMPAYLENMMYASVAWTGFALSGVPIMVGMWDVYTRSLDQLLRSYNESASRVLQSQREKAGASA